ncbi:hypothetical protein JTZ62_04570 [Mammaliicoccus sciuri]|uniref:DUF7222 domain-containing protein n=1 Tax=Mammaliicoccus sciuri TaxID=1296 RepID=UPI0019D3B7A2|nr:hypothetical protein [Mammaliicoccus sciuri]QSN68432.1 hypothetical protein JTZ62_04570 [Mammaliicoccus sciuri]UIU23173.1 hypothetical protein LLZ87_04580 [Mammaliicoccus sciuri]UIU26078.1 hypothetical protein LLZ92_04580 [Mammaliicoccus sciuri]
MKSLIKTLIDMKRNTNGIKKDVINYLLENNSNDDELQTNLEDINNYGAGGGRVNHLIYLIDTLNYFDKYKHEIIELLNHSVLNDIDNNIKLTEQNKNKLSQSAFEYKALELYNDLQEMNLIKVM